MDRKKRARNVRWLLGLILIGVVYTTLLAYRHPLTTTYKLDGILGVMLGLYTCAQPAANFLDMLLYGRGLRREGWSLGSVFSWLALNTLVLGVGWIVVVNGMIRFSER